LADGANLALGGKTVHEPAATEKQDSGPALAVEKMSPLLALKIKAEMLHGPRPGTVKPKRDVGNLAAARRSIRNPANARSEYETWLPLVDALRTLLLAASSEVREILDRPWAHRHVSAPFGT